MILSEEHSLIRETIAELVASEIAPLATETDRESKFPMAQMKAIAQQGMLLIKVPDDFGGGGGDALAYAILMEEVSKECCSTGISIAVQSLVADCILKFGTDAQKQKYIPRMATAEIFGGFALTEPEAGSDAASITTSAENQGNHYIINGKKSLVTSGDVCDFLVVIAKTGDNITAFIVEKDQFTVGEHEDKMGLRGSHTVDILFENSKVHADNVLGAIGQGLELVKSGLNGGRIGVAAQAVGIMQACVEESISYTTQRVQFGKAISDNQAIRNMIADMYKDCEAARQLVWHAAALSDDGQDYVRQASAAKLFASEAAMNVAINAIQVQGGYGYCKPAKVERLFRDAKSTAIYEGTSEIQKIVIAKKLIK